jgi:hypothetical protein
MGLGSQDTSDPTVIFAGSLANGSAALTAP